MVHLRVKKGLSIPIIGRADTIASQELIPLTFSIDLGLFKNVNFRVLVQEGQVVAKNQPLVEIKENPHVQFAAPVDATIKEIRRGEKRRLLEIVCERFQGEPLSAISSVELRPPEPSMSDEEIAESLSKSGLITRFFQRPFNRPVIDALKKRPKSCFVRAVDMRPFSNTMEEQLKGLEQFFRKGLEIIGGPFLSCPIHIVTSENSSLAAWIPENRSIFFHHSVSGPYPACSSSVHIHEIDPICSIQDTVWTIDAVDVCRIGFFSDRGSLDMPILISRSGEGFLQPHRQSIWTREGASVQELVRGALNSMDEKKNRIISGDPLNGVQVALMSGFLRRGHSIISAIPEQDEDERELLHFFRAGIDKFSASKAYLSGHMSSSQERLWRFTTNMHGEERAFIDGSVYEKVVPLNIFPMQIVKAVLAEDFDKAIEYGLLEVVKEDFALPEFVCPSKIPMMAIMEKGFDTCVADLLS